MLDARQAWAVTVWLAGPDAQGRFASPAESATMDVTPRRCQKFKPAPGEKFRWSNRSLADGKVIQSGTTVADRWGLVTLENVTVSKGKHRIEISRRP